MIFPIRLLIAAAALGAPAFAGDVDDVMATPSRAKAAAAAPAAEERESVSDYLKDVHGEVTFMVGSDGTYGASGTAVLPLGENGVATVTLSTGKGPAWLSPYSLQPGLPGQPLPPYDYYRQKLR